MLFLTAEIWTTVSRSRETGYGSPDEIFVMVFGISRDPENAHRIPRWRPASGFPARCTFDFLFFLLDMENQNIIRKGFRCDVRRHLLPIHLWLWFVQEVNKVNKTRHWRQCLEKGYVTHEEPPWDIRARLFYVPRVVGPGIGQYCWNTIYCLALYTSLNFI